MKKGNSNNKNVNMGHFVDQMTLDPKVPVSDFIQFNKLSEALSGSDHEQKMYILQCLEIALSCNKQEQFMSYGEKIAINSLRNLQILV
jgi:hypothetical protein